MFGRERNRPQYLWSKFRPAFDERTHELGPLWSVDPKGIFGCVQITFQHHSRAVIERVSQRSWRVNPLQAVVDQGQRREKWRPRAQRKNCRSKIMPKAR